MKKLKIFPKMFIQTFSIIGIIIILIHLLVFFIFPKTYLDTRKEEINYKADEISNKMEGKDIKYIEQSLEFHSSISDIKAFVKGGNNNNEVKIKNKVNIDLESDNNSLIIEERSVTINNGDKIFLQFISTANMQKDAKELSFKFLPYSLLISLLFSAFISFFYAKSIKNNIQEIKNITDRMMVLDKNTRLKVDTSDEVGQLKEQINDLYVTLLKSIDDLEYKNKEILRLEKIKYDFFKGASHELKTPLASLKIILENMKYNIGKYKNKDIYINDCIEIVDNLSNNVSKILSIYSIDNLKNDEEILNVNKILIIVLEKYEILASQKKIMINNFISDEKLYIGKRSLDIVLSNLISNAIKYSDIGGSITIGVEEGWLYIKNSVKYNNYMQDEEKNDIGFNHVYESGNGLGLYIVSNLLDNYAIDYRILKSNRFFIFKIKLT